MDSQIFDNGTVCVSEQSVITEYIIAKQVEEELLRQGAYFLNMSNGFQTGKQVTTADY